MLIAAHSISGGVLGLTIDNPILAFLLGIVLHFALDTLPHFDTTDNSKLTFRQMALIIFDLFVAIFLIVFYIKPVLTSSSPFLWGAIGGILPDVIDDVPLWNQWVRSTSFGKKLHLFHISIQPKQIQWIWGLVVQWIVIVVSLYLSIKIK